MHEVAMHRTDWVQWSVRRRRHRDAWMLTAVSKSQNCVIGRESEEFETVGAHAIKLGPCPLKTWKCNTRKWTFGFTHHSCLPKNKGKHYSDSNPFHSIPVSSTTVTTMATGTKAIATVSMTMGRTRKHENNDVADGHKHGNGKNKWNRCTIRDDVSALG